MSNEWKVCTLDQAKRLDELGVVFETEKYFVTLHEQPIEVRPVNPKSTEYKIHFPAPDVAELGELLPNGITIGGRFCPVKTAHKGTFLYIQGITTTSFTGETEAQARCAALIWTIENGHIKANEVK